MNIYGLAPVTGACHWYRIREPLRALAGLGHMTSWGEYFDEQVVSRHDTIVSHMLHGDDATLAWRYLHDEGQHRLIIDLDDNVWAWPEGTDQHKYWRGELRLQQLEQNMRLAHLITTPSPTLRDRIVFTLGIPRDRVAILPNFVPAWTLDIPRTLPDKFTLGYQGAPQRLHQADLDTIQTELFSFLRLCRDARLLFFGQPGQLKGAGAFANRIDFLPWTPDIPEYYHSLHAMTIGMAPLARSAFTDCKSGVRAAELHALGIPGVYTKAPPYLDWVDHRTTGYLAGQPMDWRKYLIKLYRDPALVERLSKNAQQLAQDWTIEHNAALWQVAYERSGPGVTMPAVASGTGQSREE